MTRLVEHATTSQGPNVDCEAIARCPHQEFGRPRHDVLGSSMPIEAGRDKRSAAMMLNGPHDVLAASKIAQLHLKGGLFRDEHVGGLQVAMNDGEGVHVRDFYP